MFGLLKNLLRSIVAGILEEDYPELSYPEPVLEVKRLFDDADLPCKGSGRAAGYDLRAHSYAFIVDGEVGETVKLADGVVLVIPANSRCLVKTGIAVAIPEGCYGRVAPRSGLALKKGIDIGAGVIDEDYRGEVGAILFNLNSEPFEVKKGDRIAQFICERIIYPELEEVDELDDTERGAGGFGSTGSN
jgi:deoxyuridine 5'-triphosphate nucleotidohydrolase